MRKLFKCVVIAALGFVLLTGCKKNDPTPTALASVGKNTTTGSVDVGTLTKTIYVSGLSGTIHEVKVRFIGSSTYTTDIQLYLKSPSGKILQLCADESRGTYNATYPAIDVTFSDAASVSVANWTSTGSMTFSGTFKPRGSLSTGFATTGTITSLSGYNGDTPNGTWTLYASDDDAGDTFYYTSWELFLSTVN
ncbi:MAG TPA: proprotein convertase P-domain-containing protein [Cytophaga sp.]|jgi:subtilisin-like proprotein convertase family protein|nr:proprotein convertase P-domain-containing protein [Cytophaga sp.]